MNRLMQMLLEKRGIYMEEAGEHGAAGGGGAGGNANDDAGDQETGAAGEQSDKGGDDDSNSDDDDDGGDKAGSGGKPGVDDEKAKLIKDTMKWKDQARQAQKELEDIRKTLGDIDPSTARKLAEDAKERERAELERKGEYDRIVAQMKDENAKLLKQKDDEVQAILQERESLAQEVEKLTVGVKFRESEYIQKQSAIPVSMAQKEFGAYFEFEDGQLVPYTKPRGEKDRTKMVDAEGNPKSFDKAIAALYEQHPDFPSLVKTQVKAGAASKNQPDLKGKEKKDAGVRGIGKIQLGLKGLSENNQ